MRKYILDATVFIGAHRQYYSFDTCPGFWDWLEGKHEEGSVFSIKKVYDELLGKEDKLSEWAKKMSKRKFFKIDNDEKTILEVKKLRDWADDKEKFTGAAREKFYRSADLFLIAYAKAHNFIVATDEVYERKKSIVKIPNACEFIDVEYVDTSQLLEELKAPDLYCEMFRLKKP